VLTAGAATCEVPLAAGARDCRYTGVRLEQGDIALAVVLTQGDKQRGVHQADVLHHPEEEQ
jgi:hypothetical protein